MSDTGGTRRNEPVVRPSKFGAGYTTGGDVPSAPTPAPASVQPPVTADAPTSVAHGTAGARSTTQVDDRPAAVIAPEPPHVVTAPTPDPERNVLATVSLILAVLFGAFIAPLTVIMAHIARSQIKKTGERGADRALAALVSSYVFLLVGVLVVAMEVALR